MSFLGGNSGTKIATAIALTSLLACSSGDSGSTSRSFGQTSCDSRDTICSQIFEAGEAEIDMSALEPEQEYILVFLNLNDFDQHGPSFSRLQVNADWSSNPVSREEFEYRRVLENSRRHDLVNAELSESIGLPANLYFGTQNIDSELYVPHFDDYLSLDADGEIRKLYVRQTDDVQLSGELKGFELLFNEPDQFDLLADEDLNAETKHKISEASHCLSETFEHLKPLLGEPLDLDNKKEINVAVARPQNLSDHVIGWVSQLDRFSLFGGREIPDSNLGENIYVSPKLTRNPSEICSTSAHEYLHLISFDHKVLRQIPEDRREDLQSISGLNLRPEKLGLEEASAQLIEELSGETQKVYLKIANFFSKISGSSFSLRSSGDNKGANLRSRGLNQLLVYHALKLYGGSLDFDDPRTQNFIRDWVMSPGTGYEHLAKVVGMNKSQLLESFFKAFFRSLYSPEDFEQFFPEAHSDNATSRGIGLTPRDTHPQEYALLDQNIFHPLSIPLDQLRLSQSTALPPGGISVYRMTVPETREATRQRLYIKSPNSQVQFFAIRVR